MVKLYAYIKDGFVDNLIYCHNVYEANELNNQLYAGSLLVIDASRYKITIGDKYQNGIFYHFNEITKEWDKTELLYHSNISLKQLAQEINDIWNVISPTIDVENCLLSEYITYRINETVRKFNEYLNENSLDYINDIGEHVSINMGLENWNMFISNFMAYRVLKDVDIHAELIWYDVYGNKISLTEKEAVLLMSNWKRELDKYIEYANILISRFKQSDTKTEVSDITIDFVTMNI